ncbi:MAG: TonB-dependent receptor [Blastomonas sp.]
MLRPFAMGKLLLLTTALYAVPVSAQTDPGSADAPPPASEEESDDQDDGVDISAPGSDFGNEIIVQGRYIPDPVRNTASVVSVLSTEDIARSGDGDIAGALERVTGLSVDSGGFVYVRGLGDRYSQALLNGTPLPSPEPLKRVVPLNIFPTSVLASAVVQKSYSVNYPGEFGGGIINLTTAAIPEESFFSFGMGIGANSETTGQLGYTHYGSDTDWTGFDDGTRDIPPLLAAALKAGAPIQADGVNFTESDLQDIAASLVNASTTLVQSNDNIPVNWSADLSAGYSTIIGDGDQFGVLLNLGYSNDWFTRGAIEQTGGRSGLNRDGQSLRTDNNIVVSGLLGFGYEFGEHKIRWTNLYIRDSLKQTKLSAFDARSFGELDPTTPADAISQQTRWIERQLIDSLVVAEFDFGDFSMDLRGGYANSQREAPYERQITYEYDPIAQDYVNSLSGNPSGASIAFSDLNEDVWSGGIDLAYNLPTANTMVISAGYAYSDTSRSAVRRDFEYELLGGFPFPVQQERPDFLLSDFNIYGLYTPDDLTDGIYLQESGTQAGFQAYDASLKIHGVYAKIEAEIVPYVTVEAGVRYEDAKQLVLALDLFGTGNAPAPTNLANDYLLPAATVTWNFAENMQLRVNASKTIARPQFRELARPQYFDTDNDRLFFGNPNLVDSELFNAEGRFEWYFGDGERFSLAGFYKKIDNPIEPFSFVPTNSYQTTFLNAPKAQLYGAEVEIVKYVPLDSVFDGDFWASRRLVAIANYTFTDSQLKVGANDTVNAGVFGLTDPQPASFYFVDGAPLTGQSKHLVNLQLGMEDQDSLEQFTFLLRYASDRVTTRGQRTGAIPDPDFIEQPGLMVDFVARKGFTLFGAEMEAKFEARNIFGEDYRETQTGDIVVINNAYDLGSSFKFSLSAKF